MHHRYLTHLICCVVAISLAATAAAAAEPAALDPDANGLYDPVERVALLEALVAACPELAATYDADEDGQVGWIEQTEGRHPITQRIPKAAFLASGARIPWAIDIAPEWLTKVYLQEDQPSGPVAELVARGTQAQSGAPVATTAQATKGEPGAGITFVGGQQYLATGNKDARWNYRWGLLTFRVDAASGAGDEVQLLEVNRGDGPNRSSPSVWYHKDSGLHLRYVGERDGSKDQRSFSSNAVVADGVAWNVLVFGIRQGRLWAELNGVAMSPDSPQPDGFGGARPEDNDMVTAIGDGRADAPTWALDALVFGLSEPSEAQVRKLSAWGAHRLGFAGRLPEGHPYRSARPVLDADDLPHRYVHDDEAWTAWREGLSKEANRVNSGGERVAPQGFERVFYDDFRARRIAPSVSGDLAPWQAPGFNTAVGASLKLQRPDREPDVYPYDADAKVQTLTLDQGNGRWWASAIYTVDDMGFGYTWDREKIFRVRCRFPDIPQQELVEGLFPAFWSYGTEWLFWRTSNRIENDWFEFDGKNGRWYNGLSTHYHYAHLKTPYAKRAESYKRAKIYSGELTEERLNTPGGIFFWDGRWRTWEFVVDGDTTYINVTVPDGEGGERWIEIARCPTAPTYLERLDLQIDYALKGKKGEGAGERQTFDVDWVEVEQKTSRVEAWGAPFTARPVLMGEAAVGSTVRCDPKLEGVSDVRYYWFADGYPLTYGSDPSYTLTTAEAGTELRCMVKAVGALDQPEAWTAVIAVQ